MADDIAPEPLKQQRARIARRTLGPNAMSFTGFDDRKGEPVRFLFNINPYSLKVTLKKDGKWIRTKYGYERQNWGNSLIIFNYTGCSGVFRPTESNPTPSPEFDIRETPAYKKLREFQSFFQNTGNSQRLVSMQYFGYEGEFIGSLDDIQLSHDVNVKPYEITYSFKFEGRPDRTTAVKVSQQQPGETSPDNLQLPT